MINYLEDSGRQISPLPSSEAVLLDDGFPLLFEVFLDNVRRRVHALINGNALLA